MDFDGASRKGKVDAVARARAAREQRERVSANLSDQHKAAVASKLQGGARRFLTVLRSLTTTNELSRSVGRDFRPTMAELN